MLCGWFIHVSHATYDMLIAAPPQSSPWIQLLKNQLAGALAQLGYMLRAADQIPRSLPMLLEALALLKSEPAPRDPAWLGYLAMASMAAGIAQVGQPPRRGGAHPRGRRSGVPHGAGSAGAIAAHAPGTGLPGDESL